MLRLDPLTKTRLILFAKAAVFSTIVFVLVAYLGAVLKPARTGSAFGGPWPSFEAQEPNSIDVMVLGTSHAFTAVDPVAIWEESGVPAFVLAGPVQRPQITVRYFDEAMRSQRPKVVAYELVGMSYPPAKFDKEFHLINVGYMPLSDNRLKAVALNTPWGEKTNVLVDMWAHHNRWTKLTLADFDVVHKNDGYEYLRGHIPLVGVHGAIPVEPAEAITAPLEPEPMEKVAYNLPALKRIANECGQRDIELLLFLSPTAPPGQYNQVLRDVERSMRKDYPNVRVVDFSLPGAVPDLDLPKDFYDGGHLNQIGSEKFSRVFARYLAETYGLDDRRGEQAYSSWNAAAGLRDAYVRKLEVDAAAKEKAKAAEKARKK